MAYAAILSLAHILDQTLSPDYEYLILNKKTQIKSLRQKVSSSQHFLDNSSHKSFKTIERLESQIIDVAYKAEDIIESHITDHLLSEPASEGDDIFGQELKKVIEEFDSINEQMMEIEDEDENSIQDLQPKNPFPVGSSKPASCGKSNLVGLDDDFLKIKNQLSWGSSELVTVSIVGMGGIGKTTLARKVYDDEYIVHYFHIRAWVTVSQDYNVKEILQGLLSCIVKTTGTMHEESVERLTELLYKNLKGRKYLIIMDDVWDTEIWDNVIRWFPNDKNGSRIILTTRLENVSMYANSCAPLHRMNFLNDDKSWSLFCDKVFGKDCCPSELEKSGKRIMKTCRGLPLAIVVIGGLLSKTKTPHYWRNVEENLTSVITSNDEHFSKILSLSYINLPHHLKGCFLYMAIFPEDCSIRVSNLIKLWIAEGIVKAQKSKSLEDVAEECFLDLVDRSLVMVYDKRFDGKIKTCGIHDLLRDLCVKEARKEKVFHVMTDEVPSGTGVRRVSIHRNGKIPHSPIILPTSVLIRSFLCFGSHSSCPVDNFKSCRLLRVWHIGLHKLSKEIIDLLNLRYLNARCDEMIMLSLASIYKLGSLQTLILDGSSRTKPLRLPQEIWKMTQLRHVQVKRLMILPSSGGGKSIIVLENLQTLSIVENFRCTKDVRRRISNIKKLGLGYDFEKINPSFYCLHSLVHLHKLEALKCLFSSPCQPFMQNAIFPESLKKMTLRGCQLPWEHMKNVGLLPNLEVLKLKSYAFQGQEWKPNEDEFLQLKFLLIKRNNLKHWRADSVHFPSLQCLVLKKCKYLEEIPSGFGEIPTFQLIELHDCGDLVVSSARQIQLEQQDFGNDAFQLRIHGKYSC